MIIGPIITKIIKAAIFIAGVYFLYHWIGSFV